MSAEFCCPRCGFGAGVRLRHHGTEDRVRCLNCGGVVPAHTVLEIGASGVDAPSERDLHAMVMGMETGVGVSRPRSM
jgi:hypothetical protein